MTIKNKYELEEQVYLRTDPDQSVRLVTGIFVKPGNVLLYELSCGDETSDHYDFEISKEEDTVLKTK
jgi:hypothetical protein